MANTPTALCNDSQTASVLNRAALFETIRNMGFENGSNQLPLNFAFFDINLVVRNVDTTFCELLDKDHNEIIGLGLAELIQRQDTDAISEISKLSAGQYVDFDLTSGIGGRSSYSNSICLSVHPEADCNDEISGYFAQLRYAKFAVNSTGSATGQAVLDSFDGFILSLDRDGKIRFANRAFASSFGIEPNQAVGRHLSSLIGKKAFEKVSRQKILLALAGQPQNFKNEFVSSKGENKTFLVNLIPDIRQNGEIDGVIGFASDITDFAVVKNELKRMYQNFELSVMSSGVGVIEFDSTRPDWCYANHIEILLELMPGELQSSRSEVRKRIHPDDLKTNDNARIVQETGSDTKYEMRLLDSKGQYRWFAFSFHLRDGEGVTNQLWMGTISDIHELKNSQLNSVDQINRRDEFLAMLSHELRNPLMAIRYSVDLLTDFRQARTDSKEFLNIISRQTTQMSRLLDDLLDVTRITQNRIELNFSNHELNDTIREVVETVRSVFVDSQQTARVRLASEDLYVDGDAVRIKQAMINLLENASKYSTTGGQIEICSEQLGDRMRFSVQDDGQGIAAEDMENIFDLFYQVDKTNGGADVGMGVGLFLVKQLIEKHGGQVAVESAGVGAGSRFSFELPLVKKKNKPENAARPLFSGAKRICLVEDIADSRIALKILLEHRGFEVFDFEDGESASLNIPNISPDIAIVDIGLPGMNGMELANELRGTHGMRDVLLIALTGYGQQADRTMINEAGFDRHIVKPAGINDVCQVIADFYAA